MNTWIKCSERVPDTDRPVIALKQLKSGRTDICIARCYAHWERYDHIAGRNVDAGPYWVCGGNNNIIYWMDLPELPEVTGDG